MKRGMAAATVVVGLALSACGAGEEASAPSTVSVSLTATETAATTVTERETTTRTSVMTSAVTETETTTFTETPPVSVSTETVTAEPPMAEGSVGNGTYLIGQTIQPGNFMCSTGDDDTYWVVNDASGEIVDNGIGDMAFVSSGGFSVEFERCAGTWEKVG